MRARHLAAVAAACLAPALAGCAGDAPAHVAPAAGAATTPATAPAAAPARSGGFAIVADGADPVARATTSPGAAATVALRVANASDVERTLTLSAEPGWLEVPPAVVVPARQSVPVGARVVPPAGASGTLRGRVVARADGDPTAAVSVSYESAVAVAVVVGGTP